MYQDLPEALQQKIRNHLLEDDFRTAKALHDRWMAEKQSSNQSLQPEDSQS